MLLSLVAEGVDTVFGYPGGQILTVYDKLYDYTDRIHHILTRHEQGAIHAAEGYARASGRPGVVIVTSGPGVANVVTGLSDAQMDSTPVVVISGQVGTGKLGSDAFQETDVIGVTLPVTKWSMQVRRPEEIPAAVAKAFYIATSGRPGPVVLDMARDAQVGMLDFEYRRVGYLRSYHPLPHPSEKSLKQAAELLNAAERPMLLAGHGIAIAHAQEHLRRFVERSGIPVASTLLGLSVLPESHPLNVGMLGMHGNIGPNYLTNKADVILAVGMRFDDRVTAATDQYARQAKVIHIDIDASEFSRNVPADVCIHSDATEALSRLTPMMEPRRRDEWVSRFQQCNEVERTSVHARQLEHDGPITMGQVIRHVSDATAGEAIVVTDVGQNQMMSAKYYRFERPDSMITSGGLGTMGFGLPAAIGAKVAMPERTVVLFCGDGGIQMTIQEWGTIMQYGVDVKMVILNNDFLGNVRQWQELFYNHRYSQTPMLNPDFVAVAMAYGIAGERVTEQADLDNAIRRMLDHPGAYLLDVAVAPEDNVFPMTPPGAVVNEILLDKDTRFEL